MITAMVSALSSSLPRIDETSVDKARAGWQKKQRRTRKPPRTAMLIVHLTPSLAILIAPALSVQNLAPTNPDTASADRADSMSAPASEMKSFNAKPLPRPIGRSERGLQAAPLRPLCTRTVRRWEGPI